MQEYDTESEELEQEEDLNLCNKYSDDELSRHYLDITAGIEKDRESMVEYLKKHKKAIKRCKLLPDNLEKNFPYKNASNVVLPYVLDAALDFNARAVPPLLERQDICYIKVQGKDEHIIPQELPMAIQQIAAQQGQEAAMQFEQQAMAQIEAQTPPKQARAERVATAVNYDLQCGIEGWREEIDRGLMILPVVGMFFKKTYQDSSKNCRVSEMIWADKMIYDHNAPTFDATPRKSFEFTKTRNEVVSMVRSGIYCNMDRVEKDKEKKEYTFIESHCDIDLDDDGYAEPYMVVLDTETNKFVSIYALFEESDVKRNDKDQVVSIDGEKHFTQTIFIPNPDGTATGLGYGILLSDMFDVIDTGTNQMIDAGTLNNTAANSAIIRQGQRVGPRGANRSKKGTIDVQIGKLTTLETGGTGPLRDDIMQLPFSGPSESLRIFIEQLKIDAREMVAASHMVDANPNEAMGLYLARLHEALVKPNSIMIRVFNGLTKEFKRIYDIQRRYLGQEAYQEITGDQQADWTADFEEDYDIRTTADPSQGSEMERAARAETYLDRAQMLPQVFDLRYAAELWVESIGLDKEKAVPAPQPNEPDPIQLIIAQAQKQTSEAEQLAAQADMISAQAKLIDANIKLAKLDIEIEEIESKVLKNLSEVDKNQSGEQVSARKLALDELKNQRDSLRGLIDATQDRSQRMAEPSTNQAIPRGFTEGM
jgi:hypothetical protein